MHWYIHTFRNYFNFHGRAGREEYWMFVLFNLLFTSIVIYFDILFELPLVIHGVPYWCMNFTFYYLLASLIPSLAIEARRIRDSGNSAWLLLFYHSPIIVVLLYQIVRTSNPTAIDSLLFVLLSLVSMISRFLTLIKKSSNSEDKSMSAQQTMELDENNTSTLYLFTPKQTTRIVIGAFVFIFLMMLNSTLFIYLFGSNGYFVSRIFKILWILLPLALVASLNHFPYRKNVYIAFGIYLMYYMHYNFYKLFLAQVFHYDLRGF